MKCFGCDKDMTWQSFEQHADTCMIPTVKHVYESTRCLLCDQPWDAVTDNRRRKLHSILRHTYTCCQQLEIDVKQALELYAPTEKEERTRLSFTVEVDDDDFTPERRVHVHDNTTRKRDQKMQTLADEFDEEYQLGLALSATATPTTHVVRSTNGKMTSVLPVEEAMQLILSKARSIMAHTEL